MRPALDRDRSKHPAAAGLRSKEVAMRKGIGGWTCCLSGLALAALAGSVAAQAPAAREKPAAIVNGEVIPGAELRKLLDKGPPSVNMLTETQKKEMEQMARDMLIDDVLMRQFLRKSGIAVSPAEVAREMEDLHQALAKQKKSFKEFLAETGQTEEQLRADVVARLQWRAYVTAKVPDAVLRVYYEQNKVFFDKVFVRASHILLRVPAKATPAEKEAIRARLAALRVEILAGKIAFAQAAKTYSDCPSKVNGGDIGNFPFKFAVQEPFARAAFALPKGALSDIVQTDFGYHLILVTDRTKGEPSTFESAKDWVREVYAQEHELYRQVISDQRRTAQIVVP
jgi:peptidyl-prolyl cis-trans isomerase C